MLFADDCASDEDEYIMMNDSMKEESDDGLHYEEMEL